MMKKLLVWVLCLILSFSSVAVAEGATLMVSFVGMRADGQGNWLSEALTGSFELWQGDALLGTLAAGETMTLPTVGAMKLVPVADTMP